MKKQVLSYELVKWNYLQIRITKQENVDVTLN